MSASHYRKVFILSPANCATGGTEALVVLCRVLNDLGVDAAISYVGRRKGVDPVPERFRSYHAPLVETIEDERGSLLIVPETMTGFLARYLKITKAIWWLSVDNYYAKLSYFGPRSILAWLSSMLFRFRRFDDESVLHFCQSHYAAEFVRQKGVRSPLFLMDYLGAEHLHGEIGAEGREDVVLYNPLKGFRFTKRLIRAAGSAVRFVPLRGLTPQQVHDWCRRAKVYVDFGAHPGKDRFPREAAMAGCLVITSKNGSAAFDEDVPILRQYKFEDRTSNIPAILAKIKDGFANYRERLTDFDSYRAEIARDKPRFEEQVRSIFLQAGAPVASITRQ